jgi:hypothetical protein
LLVVRLTRKEYRGILCAAFVLTLGLAPRAARAEESVDAIVTRGLEYRRAGRDSESLAEFQRALRMEKTARIQAQVALAEQALGLWVPAESHLIEALASGNDPWIRKNLAALTRALGVIQEHLGSLEVWGTPKGAEILVDGKPVGRLPLASPVRVLSGDTVILGARADGFSEANRNVRVPVGGTVREHVELVPLTPPRVALAVEREAPKAPAADGASSANARTTNTTPPTTANSTTMAIATERSPASGGGESSAEASRDLRPFAWVAAAGAVGGLVLGVVETVIALDKKSEFDNHTNLTMPGVKDCFTANLSPACKPISEAHDKAVTLEVVGYAVGGALGVGSMILFWLSSKDDHAPGPAVACLPDLFNGGVACRLRF